MNTKDKVGMVDGKKPRGDLEVIDNDVEEGQNYNVGTSQSQATPTEPWWKRNKRYVGCAIGLFLCASVAVLGALLVTQGGSDERTANNESESDNLRSGAEPTKSPSSMPIDQAPTVAPPESSNDSMTASAPPSLTNLTYTIQPSSHISGPDTSLVKNLDTDVIATWVAGLDENVDDNLAFRARTSAFGSGDEKNLRQDLSHVFSTTSGRDRAKELLQEDEDFRLFDEEARTQWQAQLCDIIDVPESKVPTSLIKCLCQRDGTADDAFVACFAMLEEEAKEYSRRRQRERRMARHHQGLREKRDLRGCEYIAGGTVDFSQGDGIDDVLKLVSKPALGKGGDVAITCAVPFAPALPLEFQMELSANGPGVNIESEQTYDSAEETGRIEIGAKVCLLGESLFGDKPAFEKVFDVLQFFGISLCPIEFKGSIHPLLGSLRGEIKATIFFIFFARGELRYLFDENVRGDVCDGIECAVGESEDCSLCQGDLFGSAELGINLLFTQLALPLAQTKIDQCISQGSQECESGLGLSDALSYCKNACLNPGGNPECHRNCLEDRSLPRTDLDEYLSEHIVQHCRGATVEGANPDSFRQCLEDRGMPSTFDDEHLIPAIRDYCRGYCINPGGNPECHRNCLEDRGLPRTDLDEYLSEHIVQHCRGATVEGANPDLFRQCLVDRGMPSTFDDGHLIPAIRDYCRGWCINPGGNPECHRNCLEDRGLPRTDLDEYLTEHIVQHCRGATVEGANPDSFRQCLVDRGMPSTFDDGHLIPAIRDYCRGYCINPGGNPECHRNCLEDRGLPRTDLDEYLSEHIVQHCRGATVEGANPDLFRQCLVDRGMPSTFDDGHLIPAIRDHCRGACLDPGGNPECHRNCLEDRGLPRCSDEDFLKSRIKDHCDSAFSCWGCEKCFKDRECS